MSSNVAGAAVAADASDASTATGNTCLMRDEASCISGAHENRWGVSFVLHGTLLQSPSPVFSMPAGTLLDSDAEIANALQAEARGRRSD